MRHDLGIVLLYLCLKRALETQIVIISVRSHKALNFAVCIFSEKFNSFVKWVSGMTWPRNDVTECRDGRGVLERSPSSCQLHEPDSECRLPQGWYRSSSPGDPCAPQARRCRYRRPVPARCRLPLPPRQSLQSWEWGDGTSGSPGVLTSTRAGPPMQLNISATHYLIIGGHTGIRSLRLTPPPLDNLREILDEYAKKIRLFS